MQLHAHTVPEQVRRTAGADDVGQTAEQQPHNWGEAAGASAQGAGAGCWGGRVPRPAHPGSSRASTSLQGGAAGGASAAAAGHLAPESQRVYFWDVSGLRTGGFYSCIKLRSGGMSATVAWQSIDPVTLLLNLGCIISSCYWSLSK